VRIGAFRARLTEAVVLAQSEAVVLERYGRPVAVFISPEHYDVLMTALEGAEDAVAFAAASAEGGPTTPVEQVRADLGLT
jgi:antitoxin Phd